MKLNIGLIIAAFVFFVLLVATPWSGLPLKDIKLLLTIYGVCALVAGGYLSGKRAGGILARSLLFSALGSLFIGWILPVSCQ